MAQQKVKRLPKAQCRSHFRRFCGGRAQTKGELDYVNALHPP